MPKTWKDYTPEEKARDKREHKRRKVMRETGRPSLLPFGPAHRKLLALREVYGMSSRDLAVGMGLSQSTVSDLVRGRRSPAKGNEIVTIPRRTHERVMAFQPDPTFYNPDARVPLIGPQRRLQAMACQGYASSHMADLLGQRDWNQTWSVMRGISRSGGQREPYIYAKTRDGILEMYAKYADVDPIDVGGTLLGATRAKRIATLHDFAPPDCWDDDTIDDPAAIPEYTGHCGTEAGWISHHLYEVPVCPACEGAVTFYRNRTRERLGEVQARYEFDATEVVAAMNRRQITGNALELEMGLTKGITTRWFNSEMHNPSWKSGLKLAAFLDLSWTDIYKRKESS